MYVFIRTWIPCSKCCSICAVAAALSPTPPNGGCGPADVVKLGCECGRWSDVICADVATVLVITVVMDVMAASQSEGMSANIIFQFIYILFKEQYYLIYGRVSNVQMCDSSNTNYCHHQSLTLIFILT